MYQDGGRVALLDGSQDGTGVHPSPPDLRNAVQGECGCLGGSSAITLHAIGTHHLATWLQK